VSKIFDCIFWTRFFCNCAYHFVMNMTDTISDVKRRKIAGWTIMLTCVGVLLLTSAASYVRLPRCVSLVLVMSSLRFLSCTSDYI